MMNGLLLLSPQHSEKTSCANKVAQLQYYKIKYTVYHQDTVIKLCVYIYESLYKLFKISNSIPLIPAFPGSFHLKFPQINFAQKVSGNLQRLFRHFATLFKIPIDLFDKIRILISKACLPCSNSYAWYAQVPLL